jgi:hypothetical protein
MLREQSVYNCIEHLPCLDGLMWTRLAVGFVIELMQEFFSITS